MKILHYMLGIPPIRGGGLIKYAQDLMKEQQHFGHDVTLLIPGSINRKKRDQTSIIRGYREKIEIPHYIIKNALPIPMANGIKDINWYTAMGNYAAYENFLKQLAPDVIHIHSLMGIHANFFAAASSLKIPLILTTHDYFGLCPALILVNNNGNCERIKWDECWNCCQNAFSRPHLVVEQSDFYYRLKQHQIFTNFENKLVNMAGKFKKVQNKYVHKRHPVRIDNNHAAEYSKLREYYQLIFRQITFFHYNSSVSQQQYEKRISSAKGHVIPITHAAIADNRKIKKFGHTLKIGYLGRIDFNKGYFFLQNAIRNIYSSGKCNLGLHIFTAVQNKWPEFVQAHKPYTYTELIKIMDQLDMVVVPSLLRETFGFTVLEAVSCGVPVVVTEFVGAKDLLTDRHWGFVVKADVQNLQHIIEHIYDDRHLLEQTNAAICEGSFDFTMESHIKDINEMYMTAIKYSQNKTEIPE